MYKIKVFLKTLWSFLKLNPIYAVIPAILLGLFSAFFLAKVVSDHFRTRDISGGISSCFEGSSVPELIVFETATVPEEPEPQPIEKQIEYKGKSVNIPKVEVANPDSKEDAKNGSYVKQKEQAKANTQSHTTVKKTIKYKKPGENFSGGIDVSSHNKEIDWAKVKDAGVQFAMIRLGYRGYLTGKIVLDETFYYNIENAYKNGIDVGVYFYSTAVNEDEAIEEAAYVAEVLKTQVEKGIKITYPVAYDFEEFYNNDERTRAKGLSASQISENAGAFLEYIRSSGFRSMIYAGKNAVKEHFGQSVISKYDFWLAHYTEATEYEGNFFMWQYTSSGVVDGISGNVDLDICGFENSNNLPRLKLCTGGDVNAYTKPIDGSEISMALENGGLYICRNTYDSRYLELKIDGVYCYVKTAFMSEIPFLEPNGVYITSSPETLYLSPYDSDTYKTDITVSENTTLDVKSVWENKWVKIKYEEKIYYIKADNLMFIKADKDETSESDNQQDEEQNVSENQEQQPKEEEQNKKEEQQNGQEQIDEEPSADDK